ncbi:MAG TPA: hypothetical protein VJH95_05325 [Candidatus Nanoarchaeia archaeon]|nr:hypothetical protein [Candidatus Nanoarchaeia archaeon]
MAELTTEQKYENFHKAVLIIGRTTVSPKQLQRVKSIAGELDAKEEFDFWYRMGPNYQEPKSRWYITHPIHPLYDKRPDGMHFDLNKPPQHGTSYLFGDLGAIVWAEHVSPTPLNPKGYYISLIIPPNPGVSQSRRKDEILIEHLGVPFEEERQKVRNSLDLSLTDDVRFL